MKGILSWMCSLCSATGTTSVYSYKLRGEVWAVSTWESSVHRSSQNYARNAIVREQLRVRKGVSKAEPWGLREKRRNLQKRRKWSEMPGKNQGKAGIVSAKMMRVEDLSAIE